MGFEVTANTMPVQHSSLQIEVVVLDSAATYQSGKYVAKGKTIVMADVRQLRWFQGWTRGYDRWSQSQDFTDFDQCM